MLAGVGTIPTRAGSPRWPGCSRAGDTQAAVMPVDWAALARAYPAYAADPFLSVIARGLRPVATPAAGAGASPGRAARRSPDERPARWATTCAPRQRAPSA